MWSWNVADEEWIYGNLAINCNLKMLVSQVDQFRIAEINIGSWIRKVKPLRNYEKNA